MEAIKTVERFDEETMVEMPSSRWFKVSSAMPIVPHVYRHLSDLILEEATSKSLIKDLNIEFEREGIEYSFLMSGVVYHTYVSFPEGDGMQVSDILPTWHQLRTYNTEGIEIPNNYSFEQLKKYLI